MKRTLGIVVATLLLFSLAAPVFAADPLTCWFAPEWKSKADQARSIAKALSDQSGVAVRPRIATSYPELLAAFSIDQPQLVYVGSFVQAIISARKLGTALVQSINGQELYSGVLIYPKGGDPAAILAASPTEIAFALGASSGESSAKAATGGKAAIGLANHAATCGAVKAGRAKAGVVKDWWWEANKDRFPELDMYLIPGVSEIKNPDNVLTASKAVPAAVQAKITAAAMASKEAFGAPEMAPFDQARLAGPLELMKKGQIDPLTYSW
jgi:ABC-type phosphate/phosphonate transport system substrate-binding protein